MRANVDGSRSLTRSSATIEAQSSGCGHRLTAKQLLMPSRARISVLISGPLRSGQGLVAAAHVVVETAEAGVGLGGRAGPVGDRDGLRRVGVDARAKPGQGRGA